MRRRVTALDDLELGAAPLRGLDDAVEQKPISAAVVIGVGGSGIHTITRLRAAVRAERPDQTAIDSMTFLGIDAVELSAQQGGLPVGVGLDPGEFFNVTADPFVPSAYIRGQLPSDGYLKQWWDPDYQVPTGPVTQGLKRERMLGRLAFYRVRPGLVARIGGAMSRAVSVSEHFGVGGRPDGLPVVPVYIVCSASGGTGSSGLLEVVFAVWRAARSSGYEPEIRTFVYLPSVFRDVVTKTPGGLVAAKAQEANSYAFFREMDHFCRFSSRLAPYFGLPVEAGGPEIPDGHLLKQVYLIDNRLRGKSEISSVADMYEVAAEAMFHFTSSDIGRPLIGVNATNTDRALEELDEFDKPRRYCGLGIARVVFPGETFRHHLTSGYIDWFLRHGLLAAPEGLESAVRSHQVVQRLVDGVHTLDGQASALEVDDEVQDFLDLRDLVADDMRRVPDLSNGEKHVRRVERAAPAVARSIQEAARERNRALLDATEGTIEDLVFRSGHGVPFAVEAMKVVAKTVAAARSRVEADVLVQSVGVGDAEEEVQRLLRELYAASRRNFHERVAARLMEAVGRGSTKTDVAERLGMAIQSWVQAIYDAQVAGARHDLFRRLDARLQVMRGELDQAVQRLQGLADAAREHWQQDALLGKDAGPAALTTLLPADAQPEVEQCAMAIEWLRQIKDDNDGVLAGERLVDFIARWAKESDNRAFFSLGSAAEGEATKAERSLVAALRADARERALFTTSPTTGERVPRLPGNLVQATSDSPDALRHAVAGLVTESQSVCWSWEPGRLRLASPEPGLASEAVTPTVTSVIGRHPVLKDVVDPALGSGATVVDLDDPERIVALSCEWAVPVHALHQVPTWEASYRQVQAARARGKRESVPPSHIDRRFEAELEELVPEYFDRESIGMTLGQALVFGTLVASKDERVLSGYDHSRSRPVRPLIAQDAGGRFEGHVVRVVDGRLKADDGQVWLGDSWQDCFRNLGNDARLQASITAVTEWLVRRLGAQVLRDAAHRYVEERLDSLIDVTERMPREQEVLRHVLDGIIDWEQKLMSQMATGM